MRRIFLLLFTCVWGLHVFAANSLTLSTAQGSPGDAVTLTASLSVTDAVVAAEVVIPLGEHITYEAGSIALASARSNGHAISASQADGELRVYIYSLSLQPLRGEEGELFTCRLLLGDKPLTQALVPQIVLSNASGSSVACATTQGAVTILAPEMQVVTPTIEFGHIPIRSTYTQQLRITNIGNQPLTVTDIAFTDAEFSCAVLPVTIAAGTTQNIAINYAPTRHGAVSAKLTIYSDAVNGIYNAVRNVALVADPFSVNELHVVSTSGVADETVEVTLTMNNMEPITAGEVRFILPSALRPADNPFVLSDRKTDHQVMTSVKGDTLTIYFFSPTNAALTGDDGTLGTLRLRLDGSSGTYYLRPTNTVLANSASVNMVSAVYNGSVSVRSPRLNAPTSLSMGNVAITDLATASLTVSNSGNAPLELERVTFLAEGYTCLTSLPQTVEQGRSTTLQVQYQPSAEGAFGTTMQLYSNDPARRMYSVSLSGSVYEPNALTLSGEREEQTYQLLIGMNNYSDIAAVQFDISGLPESGVTTQNLSRLSQHSTLLIPLGGGSYRVATYSMANAIVSEHEGNILSIAFPVSNPMVINATISNIVLSSPLGANRVTADTPAWHDEICEHTVTVQPDNSAHGTVTVVKE